MKSISVIIPTFNRFEELLITLPQLIKYLDPLCELLIFDQSNSYDPREKLDKIDHIISNTVACRYYHSKIPSVPLAWNTAASLSKKDILLFIDDDIDINFDLINAHRSKYEENPQIIGVAGGYYASSYKAVWIPSSKNGFATTIAGVNVSFLRKFFTKFGAASSFKKPYAGFDWEIAEHLNKNSGRLAVGDNILPFHRAPASGGCENQGDRDNSWYYGAFHNHFLWILTRQFPAKIYRLPRHFYWLYKYCRPSTNTLFSKEFLKNVLLRSIRDAYRTYKNDKKNRKSEIIAAEHFSLIYDNSGDVSL